MSRVKNCINVAIGRVKTDLPANAGICIGIIAGTALKDIGLGLCLGCKPFLIEDPTFFEVLNCKINFHFNYETP